MMVCLLLWAIGVQLTVAPRWGHESYPLGEWLINYAGGFVRRGLPGAWVALLAGASGIQANHLAIFASLLCYLLLMAWFLRYATRTFPAALILSCVVMGFPAYQECIVRKDCLGLLLLLGCLKVDVSRWPRAVAILVINGLACVAILSHEAFAFYALPALVCLVYGDRESLGASQLLLRCLALLPAAGCFCLVSVFHGTPAVAAAVNHSWLPLWRTINPGGVDLDAPVAAIQALGWTSQQGLSPGILVLTSGLYQPVAWAGVFVVSFVLVVMFTGRDGERGGNDAKDAKIRVTALLLAQALFIFPLCLLGCDYGRWLFFWVGSSLMLHTEHRRAPRWLETAVARAFARLRFNDFLVRWPANDWYLLCFGVPICWTYHNFLIASPIGRHLEVVWLWFR